MKYLIVLSALFLVACGQPMQSASDPRSVVNDSTFQHYVDIYKAEKGRGLDYDIPIGFADLQGSTVGLCTRWSNGYRQIQVDREYWENPSQSSDPAVQNYWNERLRVSLISHELGHCDLNRDHSTLSTSIMYYMNMGSQDFNELFGRSASIATKLEIHDDDCVHDIEVE